jgi:hypothetical protein
MFRAFWNLLSKTKELLDLWTVRGESRIFDEPYSTYGKEKILLSTKKCPRYKVPIKNKPAFSEAGLYVVVRIKK